MSKLHPLLVDQLDDGLNVSANFTLGVTKKISIEGHRKKTQRLMIRKVRMTVGGILVTAVLLLLIADSTATLQTPVSPNYEILPVVELLLFLVIVGLDWLIRKVLLIRMR